MILTELGLTFQRVGDSWQCVEHPALWMLRSGDYQVAGVATTFRELAAAVRALTTSPNAGADAINRRPATRTGRRRRIKTPSE
jgi:hypothetical protein